MTWAHYSKKLAKKIAAPRHVGFFSPEEAQERGMRLAIGISQSLYTVHLYLLVDESDGVIADAKFQALGPSALIGAAEGVCELLIRKNYDQASRITADFVDHHLSDREGTTAFPKEVYPELNLVIDAIEAAVLHCRDIPLAVHYVPTPLDPTSLPQGEYPGWKELSKEQQIGVIEQVIATDIRPYIELDDGGVHIVDLICGEELKIAYEGACTSCFSATGTTLSAIQNILRAKIDPKLTVTPVL